VEEITWIKVKRIGSIALIVGKCENSIGMYDFLPTAMQCWIRLDLSIAVLV
jgi:hypothetical protein